MDALLWEATLKGDYDTAQDLISKGADVDDTQETGFDPVTSLLHCVTARRDVKFMRLFINHDADCNARDSQNRTPLHWAVTNGGSDNPEMAEILLNGLAIVDARDRYQATPLLQAMKWKSYQSALLLISRGASIQVVDYRGWSLLHYATTFIDSEALNLIKLLISHKVNVDTEDHEGNTALHVALGRTEIVRFLLDNGADINKKESQGDSPLHLAASKKSLSCAYLLLKRGAEINEVNNAGNTALHTAIDYQYKDVVALLVSYGADMNMRNNKGKTALQLLPNKRSSPPFAKIIIRGAVKREALGQPICEENRQVIQSCEEYSEFEQECYEEIMRMRSEWIDVGGITISFFDIFSKKVEELAALTKNRNFFIAFVTSDYQELFNLYGDDITRNFDKAKRHADFLIQIGDCLVNVLGNRLPRAILQKIAAYVEDVDKVENNVWKG